MSVCAAAVAATAALSGSALADDAAPAAGCPVVPTVQPFAPWQDLADYFLAPGGDIEDGASSWDLSGGAAAVEGNEPFRVSGAADHTALRLPAGADATTARFCVGVEHRTMRFFARGSGSGTLKVSAVYAKRADKDKRVHLGTFQAGGEWTPSPVVPMLVNELAPAADDALSVSLSFSARGSGSWDIDDVFVDPYRRG
ncbi:MAG: hypothetical protein ACRDMZ_18160 [Solirubrobacteraceae bacterium]